MAPNGSEVKLGSFDGTSTYPVAMPMQLLALAALVFATLTTRFARVVVISIAAIAELTSVIYIGACALTKQISSLDGQLDRLTGIANTHGISDLSVASTVWPIFWIGVQVATLAWLGLGLVWQKSWNLAAASAISVSSPKAAKSKTPASSIELWDQQRD
ncbi:MAG: hypothetical protein RL149_772 [Actinomycetota bacterium]